MRDTTGVAAVRCVAVEKRFGEAWALDGLTLTVPVGVFYLLVGENGAGKTTTLRLLLDLVRADRGRVEVFGLEPRREAARVRAQIGWVPERSHVGDGRLEVRELLRHHASYHPTWDEEYASSLARALEVDASQRYGALSKGAARRVQLVMALAHRPPLLLLDEPMDGLDPVARDRYLSLLAEHLATTPATVILSTHVLYEAQRLAEHVGVLRDGRLCTELDRADLERRVRRYRAAVPEGWRAVEVPGAEVLRREASGREILWLVRGEQAAVVAGLSRSGAEVRDVEAVAMPELVVALMARERNGR